ncbi:MAG: hypothetical protein ACRC41_16710 [Sarcina sp.]
MNTFDANGIGHCCGGSYEDLNINGIVKIEDDIIAQNMSCNGIARVKGIVKVTDLNIDGVLKQFGDLDVENLNVNGRVTTTGNIKINNLRGCGELKSSSSIVTDIVNFRGSLSSCGDFTASEFNVRGCVRNIEGLLNSEIIDITFEYGGYINEIGGSVVKITKNRNNKFFSKLKPKILKVNSIDADDISLEFSKVGTINGHNIVVGDGCIIDKIEYTGRLEISPNSKVTSLINRTKEKEIINLKKEGE